jgi:hypothetical protein
VTLWSLNLFRTNASESSTDPGQSRALDVELQAGAANRASLVKQVHGRRLNHGRSSLN